MENYNLEGKIADQENNAFKVQNEAVQKAKENIANRKLEEETKRVEERLAQADRTENEALRGLRMARKKEDAQKTYLTAISKAKSEFEADGDYRKYDKAVDAAEDARDKAIAEGKRSVYGDDYWRY